MKKPNIIPLIGLSLLTISSTANAVELPEGFVVNASNLSSVADDTYQGVKIGELFPDSMIYQINNYALEFTLRDVQDLDVPEVFKEASRKNIGKVTINAAGDLDGYEYGIPFPDLDESDPDIARKLSWNIFWWTATLGGPVKGDFFPIAISAKTGVERVEEWEFVNFNMSGRFEVPHSLGDGTLQKKQMLVARKPYDINGIGSFTHRYADGRTDDSWVYIRAIRRIRRVTGGTWMDPLGSTDQLNDDVSGFNAYPTWYQGYKYLGKRFIPAFAVPKQVMAPQESDISKRFPKTDFKNWPHWNPLQDWEPREVYVLEAIPPKEHPYSKKIVYIDVNVPLISYMEMYNKRGELWKVYIQAFGSSPDTEGLDWPTRLITHVIDLKMEHATNVYLDTLVLDHELSEKSVNKRLLAK